MQTARPFPVKSWYLAIGIPICLFGIVGLAVNPFPEDFWFWTKDSIFRSIPGGSAYTPVAAPAYVFAVAEFIAKAFGGGLEAQFRVAAALLNVLHFLAAGLVLASCIELGRPRIGVAVAVGTLLVGQSLYLTQSFWSEGVVLPLIAMATYACVRFYTRPPQAVGTLVLGSLCAGVLLGLLTITRLVPGLFVAAVLFLIWMRLPRRPAMLSSGVILGSVATIIVGQMAANEHRFGKFTLSDSGGLHLWNGLVPNADEVFDDSDDYRALTSVVPDIKGMRWFEVCAAFRARSLSCPHDRMKRVAFAGVVSHPWNAFSLGFKKFAILAVTPPTRFGLSVRTGVDAARNPLSRTTYLPPLVPALQGFPRLLDAVYAGVARWYPFTVLTMFSLSMSSMFIPRTRGQRVRPLAFALLVVFLSCSFVSALVENANPRQNSSYLPLVAVLLCYSLGFAGDLVRSAYRAANGGTRFGEDERAVA